MRKSRLGLWGITGAFIVAAINAQALVWTWDNHTGDNNFNNSANWISESNVYEFPASETMVIEMSGSDRPLLSEGSTPNMDGLRVAYVNGSVGAFEQSGGVLNMTANSSRETVVGHAGGTGTWTMSGGAATLNNLSVGASGNGTFNMSGGEMNVIYARNGCSLLIGSENSSGDGTVQVSGGTLATASGIILGNSSGASGTVHIHGDGVMEVGSATASTSGFWMQDGNSTLKATIDSDNGFSLGQIVLFDGSSDNPTVTFEFGAKLDVSFSGAEMGDVSNSWDLITWPSGTTVTGAGLAFSGDVDLDKWSFEVTDTALQITYGIGTEAEPGTEVEPVVVSSLAALNVAVAQSQQHIVMTPGQYNLENGLSSGSRVISCSGSDNTIDLTGVYIAVPVGCVTANWFEIPGDNNTLIGGEIEDTYRSGLTEVTDFSAYNQDRSNLAEGLGGAAVVKITGDGNLLDGLKLTTRGSFPYGYGSMYGIGAGNTFGLDKRCGILITGGDNNTIDHVEVQHRAFGHGIYIQGGSAGSVIKNTLVEGRVRPFVELHQETHSYDLPYRTDYLMPHYDDAPIPTEGYFSLCEDGIRAYTGTGSVTVENCTVKKMRGGIRLYLASSATVRDSTAIDCASPNFNMPNGGIIINSSGNFSYGPLSDFRLSRSNMNIEWTIIPSPHAEGPHNLTDVLGNNHHIVFHRTPGPIDTNLRSIVVSGDNSTITNFTEYPIILEASASGNTIYSHGPVTDSGSGNRVTIVEAGPVSDLGGSMISDGSQMALSWTAVSGKSYCIAATTNLVDGPWIDVTNGITGMNTLVTVTNAVNEERRFFRVDVEE